MVYCDRFVKDFKEIMMGNLGATFTDNSTAKAKPKKENKLQLVYDVKHHVAFCQER
jgi:hypothetical protein